MRSKKSWVVLIIIGLSLSCGKQVNRKKEILEIPEPKFIKQAIAWVINDIDTLQTIDIELAKTPGKRSQGLMYRKSMKKNQGMLFIFKEESIQSFFMKNTYIPLDLIFIDRNGRVVDIAKRAKVMDLSSIISNKPAMYVLEVNAGLSDEWKIFVEQTKINWLEI